MSPEKKLVRYYRKIADLTMAHCEKTCIKLGSCCHTAYCDMAIDYAQDRWGLTLARTENKSLPLLGPDGVCTAPPHVRPACALHQCEISSLGFFNGDQHKTDTYFRWRDAAAALEFELFDKTDNCGTMNLSD